MKARGMKNRVLSSPFVGVLRIHVIRAIAGTLTQPSAGR